MVVSWWSYSTPLWYAQIVEGRRPDIFIVDDRTRLDQGLGQSDRRDRCQPRGPARLRDAAGPPGSGRAAGPVRDRPAHLAGGRFADARAGAPSGPMTTEAMPATGITQAPRVRRACRTSSRPTTRRRTSRAWSTRRSRRCRCSPRRSRSSRSTTGRATRRRRSPTTWPRAIRTSCASSTTRRTSATAPRSARASPRPATSSSRSPTATASSRSRTSAGSTARLVRGRRARRRRRLPDQARRPAHPHRLRAGLPARQPDLLRAQGHATSTAPASSSGARRSRASASSRAGPSSRPSC